jgi:hypothetical protein
MKLTKQQLKQIIKEELEAVLSEEEASGFDHEGTKTNIKILGIKRAADQIEVRLSINGEELEPFYGAIDAEDLADKVIGKLIGNDEQYWFMETDPPHSEDEYYLKDYPLENSIQVEFKEKLMAALEAAGATEQALRDAAAGKQWAPSWKDENTRQSFGD